MPEDVGRPIERRIDVEKDPVGDEPEEIARTHRQPRAGRHRATPKPPQPIENAQSQPLDVRVEAAPLQDAGDGRRGDGWKEARVPHGVRLAPANQYEEWSSDIRTWIRKELAADRIVIYADIDDPTLEWASIVSTLTAA